MEKIMNFDEVNKLYSEVKKIFLSYKDNSTFVYTKKEHLGNRDIEQNIKNSYYDEEGRVEFKNINGDCVTIELNRWHQYKRWSKYGLYDFPNLSIKICVGQNVIWEFTGHYCETLKGSYYNAKVTSLVFPREILMPQKEEVAEDNKNEQITEVEEDIIVPKLLLEELKRTLNSLTSTTQEREKVLTERDLKIKKVIAEIMSSYSKRLEDYDTNIRNTKNEMNYYSDLIIKYSTFSKSVIGAAIEHLIRTIEHQDFTYTQVNHIFYRRVHGPIDSWDETVKTNASIIIRQDKLSRIFKSSSQQESKIDALVDNGDAILLSEESIYSLRDKEITFYNVKDGQITSNIKLEHFPYIEEFIKRVIQYRFENGLETLTQEDMNTCIQNFLREYRESIKRLQFLKN